MPSRKSKRKLSHKIDSEKNFTLTFDAIGTSWKIDLPSLSQKESNEIARKILDRIYAFDMVYSRFREDSLVYQMYKNPGTYELPSDASPMLNLYWKLYHLSNGSFTPLIGTILEQAGYDKDYSFLKKEIKKLPTWEEVISYTENSLTVKNNMLLDFGACGKGYLVDLIGELLEKEGRNSYCIDASGDILYKSDPPIRVGLEHPDNPNQVIGVTSLQNQSICASAGNRRRWEEFHHIIDPHTISSPQGILATWVIADTGILADALATCLFLTKPEVLEEEFSFEYLILHNNFMVTTSDKFNAELYYN